MTAGRDKFQVWCQYQGIAGKTGQGVNIKSERDHETSFSGRVATSSPRDNLLYLPSDEQPTKTFLRL